MALKIIKPNSARVSAVRQFRFSQDSGEPASFPEPQDWSAPEMTSQPDPAHEPKPIAPLPPPVDLAQLEKTAYESGFIQGEKAGMEIAEQKMEAVMRRYSESVLELEKLRTFLYAQVEHEVVKLSVEVAKKIVHREVQVDKEIIQTLVRVALSHVAEKSAVTVHLNPVDYNYLIAQRAELSQSEGRDISLLADKSIERGGCLIQTECGDIDARIEEKFKEVEQMFFDGVR
jgi:flagellar assembly protein FliH